MNNAYGADKVPELHLKRTTFDNVNNDAIATFLDPDPGLASIDHCGSMVCTGPLNIYMDFKATQFTGLITPTDTYSDF